MIDEISRIVKRKHSIYLHVTVTLGIYIYLLMTIQPKYLMNKALHYEPIDQYYK